MQNRGNLHQEQKKFVCVRHANKYCSNGNPLIHVYTSTLAKIKALEEENRNANTEREGTAANKKEKTGI